MAAGWSQRPRPAPRPRRAAALRQVPRRCEPLRRHRAPVSDHRPGGARGRAADRHLARAPQGPTRSGGRRPAEHDRGPGPSRDRASPRLRRPGGCPAATRRDDGRHPGRPRGDATGTDGHPRRRGDDRRRGGRRRGRRRRGAFARHEPCRAGPGDGGAVEFGHRQPRTERAGAPGRRGAQDQGDQGGLQEGRRCGGGCGQGCQGHRQLRRGCAEAHGRQPAQHEHPHGPGAPRDGVDTRAASRSPAGHPRRAAAADVARSRRREPRMR